MVCGVARGPFFGVQGIYSLGQWWPNLLTLALPFLWQGVHISKEVKSFLVQLLSQGGSREASQKPAVMLGEFVAEGVLLEGCMSVLVFTGWYIQTY